MKQLFIIHLFILTSFAGLSQRTVLTVLPKTANVTLNGEFVANPVNLTWDTPEYFVIAAQMGYVTHGEKAEEIIKRGTRDTIKLTKISKLPTEFKSRKIEFVKYIDRATRIKIEQAQIFGPITSHMAEWGFEMVGTSTVFEEKGAPPDLVLALEIISYGVDLRGVGKQLSVLVTWTLFDTDTKKVTYTCTTGGFCDTRADMSKTGGLTLALKDALVGLMTDAKFQALAIEKEETTSDSAHTGVLTTLPKIAPVVFKGYGDMIKNVKGSVVTVKTDAGFGSGFVISKTGFLLTNYHVISGSTKIEVVFDNGFSMDATVINSDPDRDVALIKVAGSGFKPLAINADEEAASIGTDVVAIGTPADLSLTQTVTKGIVSGNRELEDNYEKKHNFIQTDVPINPGNSGGPMINNAGEVIGIIAMKSMKKGIEGLGFAIPIGEAMETLNIKFE